MTTSVDKGVERSTGAQLSYRLLDPPDPDGRPRVAKSKTIVCGVDGGETAHDVAQVAAELSDRLAARLVLVHVAPIPTIPGTAAVPGAAEELRRLEAERARRLLTGLLPDEWRESHAERRVAFGSPAPALEAVASEQGADLIVVGSRGRGPLSWVLRGSVSGELARSAPCPVVVVSPHARHSA